MSFNQELFSKSVKGLPKDEQQNMLDLFGTIVQYKEDVVDVQRITEAERSLIEIVTFENSEMRTILIEIMKNHDLGTMTTRIHRYVQAQ